MRLVGYLKRKKVPVFVNIQTAFPTKSPCVTVVHTAGSTWSPLPSPQHHNLPQQQIPDKRLPICNYIWTPLSTAEIYYCDAIEQTSIARYLLCIDCLRDAGHRLSQRVHSSLELEGTKYQ